MTTTSPQMPSYRGASGQPVVREQVGRERELQQRGEALTGGPQQTCHRHQRTSTWLIHQAYAHTA